MSADSDFKFSEEYEASGKCEIGAKYTQKSVKIVKKDAKILEYRMFVFAHTHVWLCAIYLELVFVC